MLRRAMLLVAMICTLAGCWNGGNANIKLGDVSIGQQMIDLQKALEEGALSQTEYDATKASLLSLTTACGNTAHED